MNEGRDSPRAKLRNIYCVLVVVFEFVYLCICVFLYLNLYLCILFGKRPDGE